MKLGDIINVVPNFLLETELSTFNMSTNIKVYFKDFIYRGPSIDYGRMDVLVGGRLKTKKPRYLEIGTDFAPDFVSRNAQRNFSIHLHYVLPTKIDGSNPN